MKVALYIIAGVLIFFGVVWVLQGMGIVEGSIMSGQMEWAAAGIASIVLGGMTFLFARRREANSKSPETE